MKNPIILLLTLFCLTNPLFAKSFEPKSFQTSNGAQVLFYQANEIPMLDIHVAFQAGSAYDGSQFGLSALTTTLLNQGNAGLNADAMADKLADSGAQYAASNNRDMVVLRLKTLTDAKAMDSALQTLALIVSQPDFPEEAFEREKEQQLLSIKQAQESPDSVANIAFFKSLYASHPYAHPVQGEAEPVSQLSLPQVKQFYEQYFVARNAIIVMVGAIDEAKAKEIAEQLTARLQKGRASATIPTLKRSAIQETQEIRYPSSQTIVRLGQLGINHQDKSYFPLMVGNYILGGSGLVSRLGIELREKKGMTYSVNSQFIPMPGPGPFLISFSTRNSVATEAIGLAHETISSFIQSGPTEPELMSAKQYLTGSFPLALASNESLADMLLKIAFYKLPKNYLDTYPSRIESVKLNEIKKAFQAKIEPNQLLQISVGKL